MSLPDAEHDAELLEFAQRVMDFLDLHGPPPGGASFFIGLGCGAMVRDHATDEQIHAVVDVSIKSAREMREIVEPSS